MKSSEDIQQRLKSLEEIRAPFITLWDSVQKYISPYVLDLTGKRQTTITINQNLYDGRPVTASRIFANGFTGNITPRGAPWFGLKLPSQEQNRKPSTKQFLKAMEGYYYNRFESSNFYEAMYTLVKNAADFGTGVQYLALDQKTKALRFNNLPLGSYLLDEDENGEVDTLYRKLYLQNRNILKKFPKLSARARKELEDDRYGWSELIHAVEPREDYTHGDKSAMNMAYSSCYFLKRTEEILGESGFESFPYIVWRFGKEPGLPYGVGPGIETARDAQMLQQVARTTTMAGHKAVDPPMEIDERLEGREELFPGGRNYIGAGYVPTKPVQTTINYPIGIDRENRLRQAIDEHYSVEFFLMLAQADRQMTAQEVMERQAEKSAILSTIIGRYNSECLDRVFDRVFELDTQEGLINIQDMEELSGANVAVDYTGPLAQVQKRHHQTQGLQQFLNGTLPLAQFNPTILDKIDFDKVVDAQSDAYNIAPGVIREDKTVAKLRQAQAQAQQEMAAKAEQSQALSQMAEVAQKANAPVAQGSPLEAMLGGRA